MATAYAVKPAFQSLIRPIVRLLAKTGCTPNQVTVAAALLSVAYGAAILLTGGPGYLLLGLPAFLLLRMGFNAADGMLAREHGTETRLGFFLNEIGDVVSDGALYLPLAFVLAPGFELLAAAMVLVFATSEFAGVLGRTSAGQRRYDGPMGKPDRAIFFSILAVVAALIRLTPELAAAAIAVALVLSVVTTVNRVTASVAADA